VVIEFEVAEITDYQRGYLTGRNEAYSERRSKEQSAYASGFADGRAFLLARNIEGLKRELNDAIKVAFAAHVIAETVDHAYVDEIQWSRAYESARRGRSWRFWRAA